jgi:uncharacterized protein (DUF2252 family)
MTEGRAATFQAAGGGRGLDPGADLELLGRGPLDLRWHAGRAARHGRPREALGKLADDARDPLALLAGSNAGRVPSLIPIRHGRMLKGPYAFYRGAAALMAHDLARVPHSGVFVQLCGDAHLANFGLFASPERRVLFGINDFDETLPGPFDWDLRRLAASFAIAARERGHGERHQRRVVATLCATFRERMRAAAGKDTLDTWYRQVTAAEVLGLAETAGEHAKDKASVDRARRATSREWLRQGTEVVDGRLRIRESPPLTYHYPAASPRDAAKFDVTVRRFFADYRRTLPDDRRQLFDRYRLVDTAVRVVGVGSVGTRCFVALFVADGDSPLLLQVKEARASVLEAQLSQSGYGNHGQRVVCGQRLLQSASDIFLGWSRSRASGFDFYVRQLRDMKGSFDIDDFSIEELDTYARACGMALACSMAKAGDPAVIAGYVGRSDALDAAMQRFALAYADRNEADYAGFKAAVQAGRIEATDA